jgi:transcriptional regulator with XRE-family HTH domain
MTLRERRKKAGLSQGDVASKMGLSIAQYSRLEGDPTRMRLDQAQKAAHILGCDLNDILATTTTGAILASSTRTISVYRRGAVPVSGEVSMLQSVGTMAPTEDVSIDSYAIEIDDDALNGPQAGSHNLKSGDWVVVDPSLTPQNGDLVHAVDPSGNETVIRRFVPLHPSNPRAPGYLLKSYNPDYDEIVAPGTDGILGVVTEVRLMLRRR